MWNANHFAYFLFLQDYELQTMTYRAMVDSQQKSPVKRRRMQSSSDVIIQEVNGFLIAGKCGGFEFLLKTK